MKKTLLLITAACLTFLSARAQTDSSTNAVPNKPPTAESALIALEQEWADAVKHQDAGSGRGVRTAQRTRVELTLDFVRNARSHALLLLPVRTTPI